MTVNHAKEFNGEILSCQSPSFELGALDLSPWLMDGVPTLNFRLTSTNRMTPLVEPRFGLICGY